MKAFFDTEKYTLVPYEYHSTGKEREYLSSMVDIGEDEVLAVDVPSCGAALLYVRPSGMDDAVPASFLILEKMESVPESHKLVVRFSEGLVTVALSDRDHLLLLCSYPTRTFTDSLYHIFAALKEVMFEPDHISIYWCGSVSDDGVSTMKTYFEKVIKFEL